MKQFRFLIDMAPLSTNNMNMIIQPQKRGGGPARPMVIKTSEAKSWLNAATMQLMVQRNGMQLATIEGPVALSMDVWRKADQGDLDNYYKGVCDALQAAGVVRNDKLIKEHRMCRCLVDKVHPRIDIVITPIELGGTLFPLDAD